MRKIFAVVLCFGILLQNVITVSGSEINAEMSDIVYVSEKRGNDEGNGTKDNPFKTIKAAKQKVRELLPNMENDIVVELEGGIYFLNETLRFDENDSGRNGYRVIYRGAEDEKAVISGGRRVENWHNEGNGIWAADIDGVDEIHEFYLNGEKKQLARTDTKVTANGFYVDKEMPGVHKGLLFNKNFLDGIDHPEDMICRWSSAWMCYALLCEGIERVDSEQSALIIQKDFQTLSSREANPIRATASLLLENAKKFMDEPGEFYYDKHIRKLYYIPKDGENMEDSDAIIPVLEKIVEISGTNAESKIENIDFKNLTFSHGAWNLPYQYGYNPVQAQWIYTADFEVAFTPSNIDVSFANNIAFYGNTFTGLGCVGLAFSEMVTNSKIEGNAFYDIKDSAISVGKPTHDYIAEADEYQDVARNKSVKASSEFSRKYRGEQAVNPLTRELLWMPTNDDLDPNLVIDLGKEYNVKDVSLLFNEGGVSANGVQLSADDTFDEPITMKKRDVSAENYKQSFAISNCDGTRYKYNLESVAKVRYVKINALQGSKLCEVKVFDADTKGAATEGVCSNNKISNNYITRVADTYWSSPGITAYYTDHLEISNNHLEKLPYSGISVGWGWIYCTDSTTCHDNLIKANFLSDIMTECYDGGGIYTLGQQPGTRIEENYIRKCRFPYGTLYLDGGSVGIVVTNNVTEDTSPYFMNSPADGENNVYHNYITNPSTVIQNPSTKVSDPIEYSVGRPTAEIKKLMNKSGLKKEYRYLLECVPEIPEDYKAFANEGYKNITDASGATGIKAYLMNSELATAKIALKQAKQGTGLWEFNQSDIDNYETAIYRAEGMANKSSISAAEMYEEWDRLKNAYNILMDSRSKLTYDGLLAMAVSELLRASVGDGVNQYNQEDVNLFSEFLANDLDYVKNGDKYLHLEQAYMAFIESKHNFEILDVENNAIIGEPIINKVKNTVDVYVDAKTDLTLFMPKFILSDGCKLSEECSVISDYSQPVTLVVKNNSETAYRFWTVRFHKKTVSSMGN